MRALQPTMETPKAAGFWGLFFSAVNNERTWSVETEWLTIEPGQRAITFYVGEPQIVVKGPWILRDLR